MRTLIADRPLDRSSKWDRISLTRRRFHSILLELPLYFQLRSCLVSVFPFFQHCFSVCSWAISIRLGFEWVLLGLLGFTGFYWVLLGSTGFYWVLLGSLGFCWVSVGFYWVLLGLTDVW